jgi:anti-anti-sigma factor
VVSIHTETINGADVVTIEMRGRFDFSVHKQFRAAYKDQDRPGTCYIVKMGAVEYIDSSALGMLLLLREHAQARGGTVRIVDCDANIRNILKIANFDRLFDIT